MWTNGSEPAIALENERPAGEAAVELRLSPHQSATVGAGPFGTSAACVKSPSWTTNAGRSGAPAAYAGAGLGVSWSANATNVNDRFRAGEGKVLKPKTPAARLVSTSTAYEYLDSGRSPRSRMRAALSSPALVRTGAVARARRPI